MEVTLSTAAMGLIPIIMAVTSVSKTYIEAKWSPLIALVLSFVAAFLLVPTGDVTTTVIEAIIMGLTASGLYSGSKATYGALTR